MIIFIKLISELIPSFKNTTSKRSPIPFSWKKRIRDYHRDEEIYDGLASGEDCLPYMYSCPGDYIAYIHSYSMTEKATSYRR